MRGIDHETVARIIAENTRPFVNDPPYAGAFYAAIGKMLYSWSQLESCLDEMLMFNIIASKPFGYSFDQQFLFGRKLTQLKNMYRDIEPLSPLHRSVISIATNIKADSDYRNFIIHAAWHFDDSTIPELRLRTLRRDDKGANITVSELLLTLNKLSRLASRFHATRSQLRSVFLSTAEIWNAIQPQAP